MILKKKHLFEDDDFDDFCSSLSGAKTKGGGDTQRRTTRARIYTYIYIYTHTHTG